MPISSQILLPQGIRLATGPEEKSLLSKANMWHNSRRHRIDCTIWKWYSLELCNPKTLLPVSASNHTSPSTSINEHPALHSTLFQSPDSFTVACFCHSGLCKMLSLHHCLACQTTPPHPDTSPISSPQHVRVLHLLLTMWHWETIYPQSLHFLTCDVADCWFTPNIRDLLFPFPEHMATHVDISQPTLQLDAIWPHSDQWNVSRKNCMAYITATLYP